MDKSIDLGNLIIPIIKPIKGVDYFTVEEVQQMINEVFNRVNPTVEQAETARQNNETTRQNNEISRQNNENIRQQNEEAREIIKERVETLIEEIERKLDNGEFIGEQGVGITNISFSENYTIIIHLSDGTVYESGSIRGEQGERGEKGDTPERGVDYWTGEDKREIIQDVENDINIPDLQERLQDAESNQLTGQASGISIDLSDSADSRVRSIELEGNSEQGSTTGKNLLPNDVETKTENGITITKNDDGTYTINGTATANVSTAINNDFIPMSGTWRLLGCPSGGSSSTYMLSAYVGYWGGDYPNIDTGNGTNITYTGNVKVRFFIKSGTTCNNLIFKPMLTTDTSATIDDFEPYTGGQASPNPNYPQEIHSTGDSGSVNEKVQNKNLFDGEIELGGINPSNGSLTESTSRTRSKNFIKVNPNTTYTIQRQGGGFRWVIGYTKNKTGISDGPVQDYASSLESLGPGILSKSFTTSATTEYIKWYDTGFTDLTEKVQIEQGTTATDYVAHEEQNISIPTQQPMRAIGEYKDTFVKVDGNWYERHYIKSKILDGSETTLSYLANYQGFRYQLEDANLVSSNPQNDLMCSHFKVSNIRGINGSPEPPIIRTYYGTTGLDAKYIFICDGNTDVNVFKTWLSNNNVELIYVLATPVDLPCTEEQVEALEALEKARTYKPVTHISSEDTVPATIDLTYVKDLETVINNLGGA